MLVSDSNCHYELTIGQWPTRLGRPALNEQRDAVPVMAGLDPAICRMSIGPFSARRSRSVRVDGRVNPR
jgi:hypothetical protein